MGLLSRNLATWGKSMLLQGQAQEYIPFFFTVSVFVHWSTQLNSRTQWFLSLKSHQLFYMLNWPTKQRQGLSSADSSHWRSLTADLKPDVSGTLRSVERFKIMSCSTECSKEWIQDPPKQKHKCWTQGKVWVHLENCPNRKSEQFWISSLSLKKK